MENRTTIEILRGRGVTDRDIEMFNLHIKGGKGSSFTDLSKKYGISAVTVSRRVKKLQKVIAELEAGVKPGDVSLQNRGLAPPRHQQQGVALSIPKENPFLALETFGELSGITNAGGSVFGLGVATLAQGFTREDLPYEERQKLAMKGASVLAGGILAAYLTYMQFTDQNNYNSQPRVIMDETRDAGE
jgi:hypothetical protein